MPTDFLRNRAVPTINGFTMPLRKTLGYDPFRSLLPTVERELEVVRTETGWNIEIQVPGYAPEQIGVVVKDDVLTVTARSEKRAFTRSLRLPPEIDCQNIDANVEYGMLALSLKRHPDAERERYFTSCVTCAMPVLPLALTAISNFHCVA